MSDSPHVVLVILAAGASTRMGKPKQNLVFRGKTLLQSTIDSACDVAAQVADTGVAVDVLVVLGANETVIRDNNKFKNCDVIVNDQWADGMSSSIQCALRHIDNLAKGQNLRCDGALFTVADLADVDVSHFVKIINKYVETDASIVCSSYVDSSTEDSTILGVPALFKNQLFAELMALSGDVGAKRVIAKYADSLASVALASASFDIDTEADYSKQAGSSGPV